MRYSGILTLLAAASAAFAQEQVSIVGKVVDEAGQPVAAATVATFWVEGNPFRGTTTDADGKFTLRADFRGQPIVILVKDKERKHGALSRFSQASFGKERTLTLEKLVTVKGKFGCKELKQTPPWTNIYLNYLPGRIRLARFMSDHAKFEFKLPPGDYQFHCYGTDVKTKTFEQFIEEDTDFKTIDLPATEIAKLYGKKAPDLKVTDARGVKKNVKLRDFKGKYVLIEFWGYW
ncbi:MAG: carboxypeptidase regulatory-like domain-containing protein [Planctomycetota bacterium]|jgi:hypothetical protein